MPVTLCDTLLRAAAAGFFQIYWSEEILEETRRNLVAKLRLTDEQAANRTASRRAIPTITACCCGRAARRLPATSRAA